MRLCVIESLRCNLEEYCFNEVFSKVLYKNINKQSDQCAILVLNREAIYEYLNEWLENLFELRDNNSILRSKTIRRYMINLRGLCYDNFLIVCKWIFFDLLEDKHFYEAKVNEDNPSIQMNKYSDEFENMSENYEIYPSKDMDLIFRNIDFEQCPVKDNTVNMFYKLVRIKKKIFHSWKENKSKRENDQKNKSLSLQV